MSELNATIQNQYQNTNIETFLKNLSNVIDKHSINLIAYLRENVFNLDTATGIGLDLWGNLLGFPRYLPTPADTGEINTYPFNFIHKNFYKLQFKGENESFTYIAIDDTSYRIILKALSMKLTTDCTLPKLNEYCRFLFSQFGGEAFVRDSETMEFATYIFRFEIPQWLKYVLDNYDILPRPAGVGFRYIESIAYYIGFEGQSSFLQTGKTDFTNFYKAIFKPIDLQEHLENAIRNFKPKQEKIITGHKNIFFNAEVINFKPKQETCYQDDNKENIYIQNILEKINHDSIVYSDTTQSSLISDITQEINHNSILYQGDTNGIS